MDRFALGEDVRDAAGAQYEAGVPVRIIAGQFSVCYSTIRRAAKRWKWSRPPRVARPHYKPGSIQAQILRVRRGIERQLAALEANPPDAARVEIADRAFAGLTRTLAALATLEEKAARRGATEPLADDGHQPPIDVAEFRRDLARRLERLHSRGQAP